jgi:hypothetical protein
MNNILRPIRLPPILQIAFKSRLARNQNRSFESGFAMRVNLLVLSRANHLKECLTRRILD